MKALKPATSLLCKLGSIAVHADEMMRNDGHELDRVAITSLLDDPEVKAWIADMTSAALLPVKRNRNILFVTHDGR